MRSYRKMNSKTIRELESIGLEVKQGGSTVKSTPKTIPITAISFLKQPVTEKPEQMLRQ